MTDTLDSPPANPTPVRPPEGVPLLESDAHEPAAEAHHILAQLAGSLDRSLPVPLGTQLRGLIEFGIALGELPAGQRLPPVRELAAHAGIAPMPVSSVYRELRLSGIVEIGGNEYAFDGEEINADAKSVSGFARKKWGMDSNEDVPIEYAAQLMHGLGIRNRRVCLVAALRSFDDVDIYWTVRDDETIAAIRDKEVEFWDRVQRRDPPPPSTVFSKG